MAPKGSCHLMLPVKPTMYDASCKVAFPTVDTPFDRSEAFVNNIMVVSFSTVLRTILEAAS